MVAKALREEMEVTLAKSSAELLATELKEREKTEMGFELHLHTLSATGRRGVVVRDGKVVHLFIDPRAPPHGL